MTNEPTQDVLDEAIAWHLRLRGAGDADWDAFVAWLEGDPARSDAYDRVEAGHAGIAADALPAPLTMPVAANDPVPARRWLEARWLPMVAAGVAILLVLLVALPPFASRPDRYEVATAAGEQRRVAIADGSSATLNGGTRLVLDRNDPRYAELVSGEATFDVRHDADHPFQVVSGEHRVRDVGTSFNLVHEGDEFAVEVIEGAVLYNPEDDAVTLSAGLTLRASGGADPVVARSDPRAIAGWRSGRLSYSDAPMRRVVRDVSRTLGVEIAVDPGVAALPFTGSLRVQSDPGATAGDLAASVGLRARRDGGRWIIEPRTRAPN